MEVVVLGGGNSPEREVSLRSAKAVASAAREANFKVTEIDPIEGFDFLDGLSKDSVILPILHGVGGEDGLLQAELEKRKLPFLGSGSKSSQECFDKWLTRQKLQAEGLPIANGVLVTSETYASHPYSKNPHALKVLHGGSSIGTVIVRDAGSVSQQEIHKLFELEKEAVLEALIIGTEITVPILDTRALPIIEIRPPEGIEFDYENKYNGKVAEICPPESVSAELQEKAKKLSEKVHQAMGCRHLSRVDIMIDQNHNLYVLEINTIPGLTEQSLYPKSALVAGMTMRELVKRFIGLVKRDYSL